MVSRFIAVVIGLLATQAFSIPLFAQGDRVQTSAPVKNEKAEPAPPRSLAGIWDSGRKGVLPTTGVKRPPMTAWGQGKANSYKPGWGPREVPVALTNDPLDSCDPAGFPRQNLFELRTIQIVQNPEQVLIL